MKRSERKTRRKRINAIKTLAIQWGTMAFMSILVFIGIFQVDKFQITRVIGPLADCASISAAISNLREDEYINRGYIDTTTISNHITQLMNERREKYYNSDDAVVSFVTTQHALVKIPFALLAVIIVIAVTVFPVVFLWEVYKHYWREFRRRWRRINQMSAKPKVEQNHNDEYYDFAQGIEVIE